jgi:predicted RNase H-like HicB family nuclease
MNVEFRLQFATRRDDEAQVFVGFCPALGVYSQGRTREQAENAVVDAVQLVIISCYERDILHSVLRNKGMTKAEPGTITEEHQYIRFEIADFDQTFERSVPVNLLSSQLSEAELCLQH